MSENRKQLVLDVLDGKERERVPSGFWFHFLEDEIHADAFGSLSWRKNCWQVSLVI